MSSQPPSSRPVGGTEHSWCKAVPTGTGITILSLLFSTPPNLPLLLSSLHTLQQSHPILRSKLIFNPSTHLFSLHIPSPPPTLNIHTSHLIPQSFYKTVEQELNTNSWLCFNQLGQVTEADVMFVNCYKLLDNNNNNSDSNSNSNNSSSSSTGISNNNNNNSSSSSSSSSSTCSSSNNNNNNVLEQQQEQQGCVVVVIRVHTAVCDRAAAARLLKELLGLYCEGGVVREEGLGMAVEDCVPAGKGNKWFWARGKDVIGYSVNSFRFSNLVVKESGVPDSTRFVRLKVGLEETGRILDGCKSKGIKLFSLLAAAGFIAAHASKNFPDEKWEKYSLATLIDCRPYLDPPLSDHNIGFYHSVIVNSHDVKGGEDVWDLARRIYKSLINAKNNNKHFTDTADLNYLMCKAIENPGLTPSSSLRTSLLSVFEDTLIENTNPLHKEIGLLDYIGCSSVHSVGPSLAIFDTIRDGELDCACVYPSPTHSREQMQDYVDHIKKILLEACVPQ